MGILALACAALAYDVLLVAVRRADKAYPSTNPTEGAWWFGYARDLTNAAGAALYSAAFVILGYPGPLAVLAGMLLMVITYSLDYAIGRGLSVRRAGVVLGGVLLLLVAAVAALSGPILDGLRGVMGWLFG